MIHSARPIVTPVANIVFALFCFSRFEKWGRTDGQHVRKMIPTTGRDFGLAEWINYSSRRNVFIIGRSMGMAEWIIDDHCRVLLNYLLCHLVVFSSSHSRIKFGIHPFKRAVLVVNKRNVTRRFKTYTQLWQVQDVANKSQRK